MVQGFGFRESGLGIAGIGWETEKGLGFSGLSYTPCAWEKSCST